jgi:multiple sugar transport system permease protein
MTGDREPTTIQTRTAAGATRFHLPSQARRWRRSEMLPAMLFISPWIIGFLCFQLYPIVASMYYSLTAYNMMQPPIFVGMSNYVRLFTQDELFLKALTNTAIYALFSVPLTLIVAFFFALLLNLNIPGRSIFRTAFYFPAIIPSVATGLLWIMLLNARGGLVNLGIQALGFPAISWLTSPDWTMPSLILLSVWGIGPAVVIFLAGLQDVPRDLYEAARLDGAGPLRLVRDVTIPILSPVILFNLVIGMISALQVFTEPFVIFGGGPSQNPGGPLNSVLMYSVRLFTVAFQQFQMGYAAAMAWILFVIIFTLSLLAMQLSRRFVHYD